MTPTHDPTEHEDDIEERLAAHRKEAAEHVLGELEGGPVNSRSADAGATFSDWLRALPPEHQDYVLGRNRADLLRRNPSLQIGPNALLGEAHLDRRDQGSSLHINATKCASTGIPTAFTAERVPYAVWMAMRPTSIQEEALGVEGAAVLREAFQRFIRHAAELLPLYDLAKPEKGASLLESAKAPATPLADVGHDLPHFFVRRPMPPADKGAHPTASDLGNCYVCGYGRGHGLHLSPLRLPERFA